MLIRVVSQNVEKFLPFLFTPLLNYLERFYVPFAQVGAELPFRVISERAERATLIITMNLPFSEWTTGITKCATVQSLIGSGNRPGAHH
jgi:hypothetical protein